MPRLLMLTLAGMLSLSAGAAEAPRTVASVCLDENGSASMPDGRVYRLQEADGKPHLLTHKVWLLIQDTAPR